MTKERSVAESKLDADAASATVPSKAAKNRDPGNSAGASKKKKRAKRIFNMLLVVLVSGLLLWLVFSQVDIGGFAEALGQVRWPSLLLALAALYASLLLGALKYAALYYNAPLGLVMRASMASNCALLAPAGGFLGMALTSAMMSDVDDVYMAASSALLDAVMRFSCLVFMGLIGVLLSSIPLPLWIVLLFLLLSVVMVGVQLIAILPKGRAVLRAFGRRMERFKWGVHISRSCQDLAHFGKGLERHPWQLVKHYALGMASELCTALPYVILGPTLGIVLGEGAGGLAMGLNDWLWVNAIVRLIAGLPISMGGLGAREGTLVLLLGWLGVASGQSLTLSLVYSLLVMLSNGLGALFFIGYPKSPKLLFKDAWETAEAS